MRKRILRSLSLFLAVLLCTGALAGCAELSSLSYFFMPKATTATTKPAPSGGNQPSATEIRMHYDERLEIFGSVLSLDGVESEDELLVDVIGEDAETGNTTLRAVGVGRAKLTLLRNGYEVELDLVVEPAPLSLFLILGEAEALGSSSAATYPVKASDGRVYYTVGYTANGMPATEMTAASCIPDSLTGEGLYAEDGTRLTVPLNTLTASGEGKYAGFASAFAYKWTEQTGERVWMLNAARENSHITDWTPNEASGNCFNSACALFDAACKLLDKELAAGHYTLGSIGYLFSQGESDSGMNADTYAASLADMHASLSKALTYTAPNGQVKSLDFGGMIAPRAARTATEAATRLNGPRAAQYFAANSNSDAFKDLYMLSNATDFWYTNEAVSAYFSRYDARSYRNFYGYPAPTTLSELVSSNGKYTEAALNELGATAAENLLYITGHLTSSVKVTVTLISTDGHSPIAEGALVPYGVSHFAAVPQVSPLWMAKQAAATLKMTTADGKTVENYYLSALPADKKVTLTSEWIGKPAETVTVPVRQNLTFPFLSATPTVNTVDGEYRFAGYSGLWTCGYADQRTGAFTPFTSIDKKYGWLYDGNNIWGGHGGICVIRQEYKFGPVANWDVGYAFTAPLDGKLGFSFNDRTTPPINDYYFGIFVNGKMVWPTANATPDNSSAYYTVTKLTTADQLNAAVAEVTATVKKGDTVSFVCRRKGTGTAEGAVYPIVKYIDE